MGPQISPPSVGDTIESKSTRTLHKIKNRKTETEKKPAFENATPKNH
jgi:hypothetical protein